MGTSDFEREQVWDQRRVVLHDWSCVVSCFFFQHSESEHSNIYFRPYHLCGFFFLFERTVKNFSSQNQWERRPTNFNSDPWSFKDFSGDPFGSSPNNIRLDWHKPDWMWVFNPDGNSGRPHAVHPRKFDVYNMDISYNTTIELDIVLKLNTRPTSFQIFFICVFFFCFRWKWGAQRQTGPA